MSDIDKHKYLSDLMQEEPHLIDDEETVWLLSYADLMTLLFTFFVMLYSSTLLDNNEKLRKSLAAYLSNEVGILNQDSTSTTNSQKSSGSSKDQSASSASGQTESSHTENLNALESASVFNESLKQMIEKKLKEDRLLNDSQLLQTAEGIEITFSTQILFDSGSEKMRPESEAALKKISQILLDSKSVETIRIEGHTDEKPIHTSRFNSNWELSGARSASIISMLETMGFPSTSLVAIGYGASRPVAENRKPNGEWDEKNMQKNRRVVMTVLQIQPKKSEK